ncbi:nuclease-related domain-containing protein [Curvibacter sp. APW13]|uniref:nuclease-related domain-containing protein n=1 Tax=Curvibacter sp. APW13 TaxID=3077236 RepID=UPI0028DE0BCC|nr:nuclease-related domain-containing protein [Curvibacter sp. APW13]MDT8990892.1 nuclease-related domain-containing protein [Curvibacter sp. APW13]
MLIKSADDKTKRLALLEDLQKSPLLDMRQKEWLRDELRRCKTGIEGERAAAFYLDGHYKDAQNNVLLHDLRFVVDGEVAQIDHLVINRTGYMVLIETKNYGGDLEVNAHGEFTVRYGKERYGIPSPYEQSRRHARILGKLLERLEISTRTDKLPEFHSVVMMHPKAIIQRPDPKAFDTSFLIKADQFPTWHERLGESVSTGGVFKALLNVRSMDTIKEWGEKLKRQHRPADLLALPDFMKPKAAPVASVPALVAKPAQPAEAATQPAPAVHDESIAKKLICAHCREKISYPEGKFCWNNAKRFGGLQYCRDHQGMFG